MLKIRISEISLSKIYAKINNQLIYSVQVLSKSKFVLGKILTDRSIIGIYNVIYLD